MPEEKMTAEDLVNKVISYFTSSIAFSDKADVFSFLIGANTSSIQDKRLLNFVQDKNGRKQKNRLFIAMVFDDKNLTTIEARKYLQDTFKSIKKTFYGIEEIPKYLKSYSTEATYEFLNDKPGITITNYIILVFNFPGLSSIEFMLTTYGLNKNSKLFVGATATLTTIHNHANMWEEKKERYRKKTNK